MSHEPIKPGEMGIIISTRRPDLQFIVGLIVTCVRYAVPNERIQLTHPALMGNSLSPFLSPKRPAVIVEHPIYGQWIHGISRILPIRPDSEDEHTEKENELESTV